LIRALGKSGLNAKAFGATRSHRIFQRSAGANPERNAKWLELIGWQDEPVKGVLNQAVALSKSGGVLKLDGHSLH